MRKFSTLAMLAVVLLFLACKSEKKEQEAKTIASLVHTIEFNGKKTPITVFYSSDHYYVADSLAFEYEDKKHLIRLENLDKFSFENLNSFDLIGDVATDYDFDGYMDIAICHGETMMGDCDIFIYNSQAKSFQLHEKLSANSHVSADAETQTIKTGVCEGEDCFFRDYKWINGQLTLIREYQSVSQGYGDNSYIVRNTKTLINGEWEEKTESVDDDNDDSCPSEAKLLRSIRYNNGEIKKFKYDDKNLLQKVSTYSSKGELYKMNIYIYSDDKLVGLKIENHFDSSQRESCTINGNTIKCNEYEDGHTIPTNSGGYISKSIGESSDGGCTEICTETYQYQNNNLIKKTAEVCNNCNGEERIISESREYKYDSEKSPFYNCKTPKWVIQNLFEPTYASKNNLIAEGYEYEYDSDGFPTKLTAGSETTTFTYCRKQK